MPLKKTNKRALTNAFDSTTIDHRLKNFSWFKTEGDWRHVERKKTSNGSFDSKVDTHSQWKDSRDEVAGECVNILLSYYQKKNVKSKCYFHLVFLNGVAIRFSLLIS